MPYSNAEILAGVLAVSCLILLYCWQSKQSKEGEVGMRWPPSMQPSRNGTPMQIRRRAGFSSVINDEDMPVGGLSDLTNTMTPNPSSFKGIPKDMVAMRWSPDMNVNIDSQNATIEDVLAGNTFRNMDKVDPSINRMCKSDKKIGSLGGEILQLTDYGPQYSSDLMQLGYSDHNSTSSYVTM